MKWKVIVVLFIFPLTVWGQIGLQVDSSIVKQLPEIKFLPSKKSDASSKGNNLTADVSLRKLMYESPSLPDAYSYEELSLFCKLEVKMEKAVQFPVKFRLGDVQYVDWLEGKDNYWRFQQPKQ